MDWTDTVDGAGGGSDKFYNYLNFLISSHRLQNEEK